MSISISPDSKRKSRIQSSEALKSIMTEKKKIHRLFEKKIPRVIAKSIKLKNKPSLNLQTLNTLNTETSFYIRTQSSPIKKKPSLHNDNDDFTQSLQRRMNKTSEKFASWSKITNKAARIRARAATPDIFYKALSTVFKEPKKKSFDKNLSGPKVSRIILYDS